MREALAQQQAGSFEQAERYFYRALALAPASAEIHLHLGGLFRQLGRHDAALDCCLEAVRLAPKDVQSWTNLGHALREKGNREAAIKAYREAIRLEPNRAEAYQRLGPLLFHENNRENDPVGALVAYLQAIRLDPKYAEAVELLQSVQTCVERRHAEQRVEEAIRKAQGLLLIPAHDEAIAALAAADPESPSAKDGETAVGDDRRSPRALDMNDFVPAVLTNLSQKLSASASALYRPRFGVGITDWRIMTEAPFTSSGSVTMRSTSSMRAGFSNSMLIERTTKA